jgi:hypothetical protein
MASDITRRIFDRHKKYVGVIKQQGRVTLDADDDEGLEIELGDSRRAHTDIIGPHGTPDDGFRITDPRVEDGFINFDISTGTMYVDGVRYSNATHREEERDPEKQPKQTLQHQCDWWVNNRKEDYYAPPKLRPRTDLVYLELWDQDVSASEDQELVDVALGGVDTAARLKTMGRVKLLTVTADAAPTPQKCRGRFGEANPRASVLLAFRAGTSAPTTRPSGYRLSTR